MLFLKALGVKCVKSDAAVTDSSIFPFLLNVARYRAPVQKEEERANHLGWCAGLDCFILVLVSRRTIQLELPLRSTTVMIAMVAGTGLPHQI